LITQMDNLIYQMLVRTQAKEDLESIAGMYVTIPEGHFGSFYMSVSPPLRDIVWALALVLVSAFVVYEDYQTRLIPVQQALTCACMTQGHQCFEAQRYDEHWWDNYWRFVVPQTYKTMRSFK